MKQFDIRSKNDIEQYFKIMGTDNLYRAHTVIRSDRRDELFCSAFDTDSNVKMEDE